MHKTLAYKWKNSHLEMLEKYESKMTDKSKVLLMVQKGDEVLDYNEAVEKLPNARLIVEEGGDNGFVGIEGHFEMIDDFLNEPKVDSKL